MTPLTSASRTPGGTRSPPGRGHDGGAPRPGRGARLRVLDRGLDRALRRAQARPPSATPGLTVGSVTATSAALAWTQPFAPTAYALSQAPGTVTGCPPAPGIASSGCTATSLSPNTTYTWTLAASLPLVGEPLHGHGDHQQAGNSRPATLSALTPTTATAGTGFSATATVTGNAGYGTPAGTATLSLYAGSTCAGAPAYTSAAQTLTGGATTTTLHPALGTYSWRATYTPTDTVNLTSTSACSAPVTVTAAGATYAGRSARHRDEQQQQRGRPLPGRDCDRRPDAPRGGQQRHPDLHGLIVRLEHRRQRRPGRIGHADHRVVACRRRAETSVTLASLKTNSDGATAWVLDYKNAGTPALAGVSSGTASSASALTPTGLTTTAPDTTVISLVGINTAAALSLQTPQGFAARASLQNATGVGRALRCRRPVRRHGREPGAPHDVDRRGDRQPVGLHHRGLQSLTGLAPRRSPEVGRLRAGDREGRRSRRGHRRDKYAEFTLRRAILPSGEPSSACRHDGSQGGQALSSRLFSLAPSRHRRSRPLLAGGLSAVLALALTASPAPPLLWRRSTSTHRPRPRRSAPPSPSSPRPTTPRERRRGRDDHLHRHGREHRRWFGDHGRQR